MHLATMANFVTDNLRRGRFAYVASLDIEGAFDTAPHEGLSETLWGTQIDPHLIRFMEMWIRGTWAIPNSDYGPRG